MTATIPAKQQIVVDEVFPHTPEIIWQALTDGHIIARWLMPPTGFEPVVGCAFTFQTVAAGAWDGVIHCTVLEVVVGQKLAYAWRGGHQDNSGYGSKLDTLVTWTLEPVPEGTRVRLVHAGFELPRNDVAFKTMGAGWNTVMARLQAAVDEEG